MTHGVCCTLPYQVTQHKNIWMVEERTTFFPYSWLLLRAEILEKHYRARANLDKVINVEWSLPSLISQGAVGKYGMDTYHTVAEYVNYLLVN